MEPALKDAERRVVALGDGYQLVVGAYSDIQPNEHPVFRVRVARATAALVGTDPVTVSGSAVTLTLDDAVATARW